MCILYNGSSYFRVCFCSLFVQLFILDFIDILRANRYLNALQFDTKHVQIHKEWPKLDPYNLGTSDVYVRELGSPVFYVIFSQGKML